MTKRAKIEESKDDRTYGVWSFGKYRNLRGSLKSNERHFIAELELGNRLLFDRKFTTVRGVLDVDDTYVLLQDCHISKESTKYGKDKVRSKIGVDSYLKLEHSSPIRKLSFLSLEVDLPKNLKHKRDLFTQYLNEGIRSGGTEEPSMTLCETSHYNIGIRTDTLIKHSDDRLTAELSSRLVVSYKKPQNINTITKDFNTIRNLIAICSYFSQSLNMNNVDLFYTPGFDYKREEPVKLNSKSNRTIQLNDSKDELPSWWLFSKFLDNPQSIIKQYFRLLDDKEFQYVIDVYLGHFMPSKTAGVTIEFQFLAAVQLLEATYERLIEDIDTEVKRKKEAFKCSCGNSYCKKCTRLQLRDLTAKLRELVKRSVGDNDKYRDFSLEYSDIAYARNYHTHGKKSSQRDIMSIHDMHTTIVKLEFIFLYIFFQELGYSNEELDKLLPHLSPFSWVI